MSGTIRGPRLGAAKHSCYMHRPDRSVLMRILIVEDEPDLRQGLAKALRETGYAVDEAPDGEEGLFKGLSVSYDAILLDVMLPCLDGWEVLRRLR